MSDIMIHAENIGKKYMISHQVNGNYNALRDAIADKVKTIARRFLVSSKHRESNPSTETLWALKNISFDIKQGECIGVIGPNGAGKSTLLKILSRITEPTVGMVRLNGVAGSLLEVGTGFHPELTGRENIFLNGAILGMSKKDIKNKFDEIVSFAEVEKFLDTPVKRYSSGMYVRLAFAVAAHLDTEILLIDEVLAVGDLAFQKKCLGKMQVIGKKEGRTVLFVSHNMGAIRSLCSNAILIDSGQVVKNGETNEVVNYYENNQLTTLSQYMHKIERIQNNSNKLQFFFSCIEMLNQSCEHTTSFKYNEKLTLIITLSGEPKITKFGVSFYIYNNFHQLVSVGSSVAYHGIEFNKETKKIKIEVGPLAFTSGDYRITLVCYYGEGPSVMIADKWENACQFSFNSQPFRCGREIKGDSEGVCITQQTFSVAE